MPAPPRITIGSLGVATYCSTKDLDFSNSEVKAYIVSAFKPNKGEVTLTRVDDIPAGTGIVVLGEPGTYDIPTTTSETIVSNMLVGVTEPKVMNKVEGEYTNYILANGSNGLGFYAVKDGTTLAANKAYLPLNTASLVNRPSAEVKGIRFNFDNGSEFDETVSIENVSLNNYDSDVYYNLSGQRIINPTRGIYIHNGKKIMIK